MSCAIQSALQSRKRLSIQFSLLFIAILLGLCVFAQPITRTKAIKQQLEIIPKHERIILEKCFRLAFGQKALCYTLFGDKPITHIGYCKPNLRCDNIYASVDYIPNIFHWTNIAQIQGWDIWEKYQKYFPSENYIFLRTRNFIDNELATILVINKKAFLQVVNQNLSDFRKILGGHINPDLLLEQIVKSDDVFGKVLKNHQGLIGTLLGYGRDNAWIFHEKHYAHMKNHHLTLNRLEIPPLEDTAQDPSQPFHAFNDHQILDFNMLCIGLPSFAADPNSSETKQLKIKYKKQYKQIIHLYEGRDFLEVTLQKLTEKASSTDTEKVVGNSR